MQNGVKVLKFAEGGSKDSEETEGRLDANGEPRDDLRRRRAGLVGRELDEGEKQTEIVIAEVQGLFEWLSSFLRAESIVHTSYCLYNAPNSA